MEKYNYIICHGSGNRFIMIDAVAQDFNVDSDGKEFVIKVCAEQNLDGALFFVRYGDGYAMRMFNTDGSEAEMCGNGMRCIARLADEEHSIFENGEAIIYSGGGSYRITRENKLAAGVLCYGVDIAIRKSSADFLLSNTEFIAQPIEELETSLKFTYLNLGNPHLVAQVENVDLELLSEMGERVKALKNIVPNGVNISMLQHRGDQQIFVSTYERGVGITASCGTAMTASSATAALLGLCKWGEPIDVRNLGGAVRCTPQIDVAGAITTRLVGNATYETKGEIDINGICYNVVNQEIETTAWEQLKQSIL